MEMEISVRNILQFLKLAKFSGHIQKPTLKLSPAISNTIVSAILKTTSASQSHPIITTSAATELFPHLSRNIVQLLLSEPQVKPLKCLGFFNLLLKNPSLISFKLTLDNHLTLICRLIKARRFTEVENLLGSLSKDENFRFPFYAIAYSVKGHCTDGKVVSKFFNLMLKVYSDNQNFEVALETFDYMRKMAIEINERTRTVHLIALMRCDQVELGVDFFYRMLESGIKVSVFSLTVVVDGLCKCGEIKRARELVEKMVGRGIKPNIITFNTLLDACARRWNFGELDLVLLLMRKEGVEFNIDTYNLLIDGFSSSGKVEDAKRTILEMHDKDLKVNAHLYTLIINGYCRLKNMEEALIILDQMIEKGVYPNIDAYRTLISGLCRNGEMEAVMVLLDEMQSREIDLDKFMFDTLIDGCCKEEMFDEAVELLDMMQKKGFIADLSAYNMIASGFCKLHRTEEASRLLNNVLKRGVNPVFSFSLLLDKLGYCRSNKAVSKKVAEGLTHNAASCSDLTDEHSEVGNMKEDKKIIGEMQDCY